MDGRFQRVSRQISGISSSVKELETEVKGDGVLI